MDAEELLIDERWLGLWVGSGKAVWIERVQDPPPKGAAFRVTVRPAPDASPFRREDVPPGSAPGYSFPKGGTQDLPAAWKTKNGRRLLRVPFLQVEAESSLHGRTYDLSFAVANPSSERYRWRAATADDALDAVRLVPDTGAGFIDAVTWQEDEGQIPWAAPLAPMQKASPEEDAAYRERWAT